MLSFSQESNTGPKRMGKRSMVYSSRATLSSKKRPRKWETRAGTSLQVTAE